MSLMRYREQKYIYGNYMEVNMYPVYACPRSSKSKEEKKADKQGAGEIESD